MIMEWVSAILLVSGAMFIFIAALGVLRMPELFSRMHSSTKAGTLGLGLIMLAVATYFQESSITIRAAALVVFIILTAPVSAHVIARAAYLSGVRLWKHTVVDEYKNREHSP
jgi:multicomponent Na+:H+ antiporter subunit G